MKSEDRLTDRYHGATEFIRTYHPAKIEKSGGISTTHPTFESGSSATQGLRSRTLFPRSATLH